jgi:hypothetical protein
MQRSIFPLAALASVALLGCHSYNPYGYNGYGPTYSMPGTYMAPGTTTYPGMAAPPGQAYSPTPLDQQPSPTALPPQTLQPNQGPLTEVPSNSAAPADSKLVPNYNEPANNGGAAPPSSLGRPGGLDEDEGFPNPNTDKPVGLRQVPDLQLGALLDDSAERVAEMGEESFARPVPIQTASSSVAVEEFGHQTSRARPNPYHYDHEGYTWLRGVVDYSERDRRWHLTYHPEAADSDDFGGRITLLDHDHLDSLVPGDVVLVEGRIDSQRRDQEGRQMYRVDKLLKLRPKQR